MPSTCCLTCSPATLHKHAHNFFKFSCLHVDNIDSSKMTIETSCLIENVAVALELVGTSEDSKVCGFLRLNIAGAYVGQLRSYDGHMAASDT
jgi:hypothetical protein